VLLGPAWNASNLVPDRAEGIEGLILNLWAFEKVKLYKARHLVEMTVALHLDFSPVLIPRSGCFDKMDQA
jgi:hypothetical protein